MYILYNIYMCVCIICLYIRLSLPLFIASNSLLLLTLSFHPCVDFNFERNKAVPSRHAIHLNEQEERNKIWKCVRNSERVDVPDESDIRRVTLRCYCYRVWYSCNREDDERNRREKMVLFPRELFAVVKSSRAGEIGGNGENKRAGRKRRKNRKKNKPNKRGRKGHWRKKSLSVYGWKREKIWSFVIPTLFCSIRVHTV